MYIELQYTLGKLNTAIYVCIEDESDSLAMHLHWSITLLFCIMWSWSLRMFVVLTTYIYTCFAQIARPSATRFISVFDNDGIQILSVDVSTSTAVIYSGDNLTITTSTSFFINKMYYLLADSGVCVCVWVKWACVHMRVCVYACMCSCERAGGETDLHVCVCACMPIYHLPLYTPELYLQVLLLLLHSVQLSHLPSHFLLNGHLGSLIQVLILLYIYLHGLMMHGQLLGSYLSLLYIYIYICISIAIAIYLYMWIYIYICGSIYISIFMHNIYIHTYMHNLYNYTYIMHIYNILFIYSLLLANLLYQTV